jgi:hypothetical protein
MALYQLDQVLKPTVCMAQALQAALLPALELKPTAYMEPRLSLA